MDFKEYFKDTKGYGVLATSDTQGHVDVAIYASPHVMDAGTLAFIMRRRRSYQNLQSNPHAAYLFIEKEAGYTGKRLYLTKVKEETDPEVIAAIRRKHRTHTGPNDDAYLVHFQVDETRPAVGG